MTYEEILELLRVKGQAQLLEFYGELSAEQRKALLKQIEDIDFSVLDVLAEKIDSELDGSGLNFGADVSGRGFEDKSTLFGNGKPSETFKNEAGEKLPADDADNFAASADKIEPISAMTLPEIKENQVSLKAAGLKAIREGKVAAVLLAGGMGTRLGIDGPKGTLNVGETRELFIFQCLIYNLLDVVKAAGAYVPLFIMTSEKNDEATRAFFKEHNFFGYDTSKVFFFIQDTAPACDYDGKIFLEEKDKVATSPNGNGGWFKSMIKAGLVPKLKEMGVEWLNIFAVDNVLQRMADPLFVGATINSGAAVGAKVIRKADPYEKVGVMCLRNGHPSIIEYYELTEEMAQQKDAKGDYAYTFGVILNYLFRLSDLEATAALDMPLHVVEKKIPHINAAGEHISPKEPNGYKFETLVLDMIERMDGCLVFEVERAKEFAPIKNMHGVDSLDSAREMLKAAGISL